MLINRNMKLTGLALTLVVAQSTCLAVDTTPSDLATPPQATTGSETTNASKIYAAGKLGGAGWNNSLDATLEFYPFDQYAPADVNRQSGRGQGTAGFTLEGGRVRARLEQEILAAVKPALDRFAQAIPEALTASLVNAGFAAQIIPAPSPTEKPVPVSDFGQSLKALPFMQKRGIALAVFMDANDIKTIYEGTLTNPMPYKPEHQKGLFDHLSSLGRGLKVTGAGTEARIQNTPPLTFDGVAKLTYKAHYTFYDVATGQVLREGIVGPITATSPPWQGSWQLPGNSGMGLNPADWPLYRKYIQDPRDTVLTALFDDLVLQLKPAFAASFNDWSDLIAASQELRAGK